VCCSDVADDLLDVKATRWHEVNNAFRTGVGELEVRVVVMTIIGGHYVCGGACC